MPMEKSKNKNSEILWKVIWISLIIFTVLGIVKSLFVSLDIDESYAVAQAYRLVTGDKLLYDMWEPHQLSAFLPALFLAPFYYLYKNTDYAVLILRIFGTGIHLIIGTYLYSTAKGVIGKKSAFLATILHVNFLPKWITMPEFELMHYWCMVLIFLLLYRHESTKNEIRVILAGLLYVVSGLCYPTMVVLLPLYVAGLLLTKKKRSAAYFAFFSVVPSIFFLVILIHNMGLDTFLRYGRYILSDPSHVSDTAGAKWLRMGADLLQAGILLGISFLIAAAVTGVLFFIRRKKEKLTKENLFMIFFSVSCTALCVRSIYGYLFGDENQFTVLVRYVPAVILILVAAFPFRKELKREIWFGILPAVLSVPAVLAISNMGLNVSLSKLFPAILAGFFVLGKVGKKDEKFIFGVRSAKVAALAILLCLFICKILLIRVTGCLPVTVKAPLMYVDGGPAKCIWVPEKPALYWNESYDVLKQLIPEKANVLYVGREQLFYVSFCDRVCTPSVQGTTVFNEIYETYYKEFPEKMPEIVVYDRSFGEEAYYAGYVGGVDFRDEWIKNWVSENFETDREVEVGNYTILYLKQGNNT